MRQRFQRVPTRRGPKVDDLVYAELVKLWQGAIRAFVVTTAANVKVQSGMSKASIRPLARVVGEVIAINAKPVKGLTTLDKEYHPDEYRSIAAGEEAGASFADRVLYGSKRRPVFQFHFNILVYQYRLHEHGWHSITRGRAAMINYIRKNFQSRVGSRRLMDWMINYRGF